MNKITKAECVKQVGGNWATIILATVIMAILLAVRIWDKLGEVWWLIFYIVEDVFISVAEKNVFSNRVNSIKYGSRYEYDIKFSCNGIGHIVLLSKNEPKEIDPDYSAVFFSKPGDKFYLLMLKGNKSDNIIKCFNAKYYQIFEDGFDCIDGIYYPKNTQRS